MSLRRLNDLDPLNIIVTDIHGHYQGVLIGRYEDWGWVQWDKLNSPVTENVRNLRICENRTSLLEQVTAYARDLCTPAIAVGT